MPYVLRYLCDRKYSCGKSLSSGIWLIREGMVDVTYALGAPLLPVSRTLLSGFYKTRQTSMECTPKKMRKYTPAPTCSRKRLMLA